MAQPESPVIVVSAVGTATGRPDVVVLTLGIEVSGRTPGEAMRKAASAAAALDRVCAEQGVAEEDRRTVQVSVQPIFDHQRQAVSQHQATYSLRLTVRDLDRAGVVVEAASEDDSLGTVLRVHHLGLAFSDPERLLAEARARAVAAARRQAEQLAEAAGAVLGPLRSLTEGTPPDTIGAPAYGGASFQMQTIAAMPVQPGTQELAVQVVATYEIAG